MKNYAYNLEKRMIKTFVEHEKLYVDYPVQIYHQNVEVCSIAVQELRKEYDRFQRNRTLKDEILFYKECYPTVARWQIYYHYILDVEKSLFIAYDDMKIKTYKNCLNKLNNDFKKKERFMTFSYLMIAPAINSFSLKTA